MKRFVILLISLSVLVGCGNKPPDTEVCAPLTRGRGYCKKLISGGTRDVEAPAFAEYKQDSLYIHINDIEQLVLFVERYCDRNKCDSKIKSKTQFNYWQLKHRFR